MLTIIVPTMNRLDYIVRLLTYYANTHCKYTILIGDSSNAEIIEKTKKILEQFKGKLHIEHHEFPHLSVMECTIKLLNLVSTPYTAFLSDDDIITTRGLEQCVEFLESHKDYAGAHGINVAYRLWSNSAYGKFLSCEYYRITAVESEMPKERLTEFLKDYSVILFSVCRTDVCKKMWDNGVKLADKAFAPEILPNCVLVLHGKVKQLDCLFMVRQYHIKRYVYEPIDEWIRTSKYQQEYRLFRDHLVQELVQIEGITREEATRIVDMAFKSYLDKFRNNPITRMNIAMGYFPGVRSILRLMKYIVLSHSRDYLLPKLLNPSSPYYSDFLPAYHAITKPFSLQDKIIGGS